MNKGITYPVKFVMHGECRFGLWIADEMHDHFVLGINELEVASTHEMGELLEIAKSRELKIDDASVFEVNIDVVADLFKALKSKSEVSPEECSVLLDFFNILQDFFRSTRLDGFLKKNELLDSALIKLFEGCIFSDSENSRGKVFLDKVDLRVLYVFFRNYKYGLYIDFFKR